MANAEQFRTALNRLLAEAQKVGRPFLELTAGELHRAVGGYPIPSHSERNHSMRNCCSVMKSEKRSDDETIVAPPSGQGASLKIRYRLPR